MFGPSYGKRTEFREARLGQLCFRLLVVNLGFRVLRVWRYWGLGLHIFRGLLEGL